MVAIFSTGKVKNSKIYNVLDPKLVDFEKASEAWVLTLLNKAIILNSKGRIIEGFGNFSAIEFQELLTGI